MFYLTVVGFPPLPCDHCAYIEFPRIDESVVFALEEVGWTFSGHDTTEELNEFLISEGYDPAKFDMKIAWKLKQLTERKGDWHK